MDATIECVQREKAFMHRNERNISIALKFRKDHQIVFYDILVIHTLNDEQKSPKTNERQCTNRTKVRVKRPTKQFIDLSFHFPVTAS